MCDTVVALSNSTAGGKVIFAKNSDRQPNEPLLTIKVPRRQHAPGSRLKCTYIEIDQAEETFEAILLKPSWMWGAEMGGNEFGLQVGNEAVFTRIKQGSPALLGMDMLRLALERCRNSEEALNLIIDLLGRYGQGGNCGYEKQFYYHNSFLIADPQQAWVLETAGPYWAAEKVKDVRAISNRLSIGRSFDRAHPDLIDYAKDKGWCKSEDDFDFARCYSNPLITRFSGSANRQSLCKDVLQKEKGKITLQTMRKLLRTHEEGLEGKQFSRHSLKSVCMHGGFIFGDHTTGSYIVELNEKRPTYLITGASTPCLSLFKPYWMIDNENFSFGEGEGEAALAFWLKRERLHRAVLENKIPDLKSYFVERDNIENEVDNLLTEMIVDSVCESELREIISSYLDKEEHLIEHTLGSITDPDSKGMIKGSLLYRRFWQKQSDRLFNSINGGL